VKGRVPGISEKLRTARAFIHEIPLDLKNSPR